MGRLRSVAIVGIDFFVRKAACLVGGTSTCKSHAGDGFPDSERGDHGQRGWTRTKPPKRAVTTKLAAHNR
jgi:hypothetical protein